MRLLRGRLLNENYRFYAPLVCLAAARARIIPLWLAVNVVILGGLGPFAGSLGFVIEQRRRTRPGRIRTTDQSLQLNVNDRRYQHR